MELDLTFYLVRQVSYPCVVRVVRIRVTIVLLEMWFRASCYFTEFAGPNNFVILKVIVILLTRLELIAKAHAIGLVLLHAIRYRVLYELVERLDLLVDDSVLSEESIDNLPLVMDIDLCFPTVAKTTIRLI